MDELEELRVDFSVLAGVDLTLWTKIVVLALVIASAGLGILAVA